MKRQQAKTLKELIHEYLRQEGLDTPLLEHRAVEVWPEVAGSAIANMTPKVEMRNSSLYIKVKSPALRQDLTMQRTLLARRVNEKVGSHIVEQIVFY